MKYYNYLLFRIYSSLSDPRKEYDVKSINILLINTSTLIIWLFCFTIFLGINCFFNDFLNCIIPNSKIIIVYLIIIAFLNYWFFIRDAKFLKYNFKEDKKSGFITVLVLLLIFTALIILVGVNRN